MSMRISKSRISLWSVSVSALSLVCLFPVSLCAEVDLEKVAEAYYTKCEAASQKLIADIEKKIISIRNRKDIDGVIRQKFVRSANDMKSKFELHGYVPMAPFLREESVEYLTSLLAARKQATVAYGRAIDLAAKQGDEQLAEDILDKQKTLITVPVIARWDCRGRKAKSRWSWTFLADGTMAGSDATWHFQNDKLVIHNKRIIDTWKVAESGTTFRGMNQFKKRHIGTMVYPR